MPTHTIQQGDHVSALAEKFGFFELKSIWDHPNNAELKSKRKDPNVVFPGDVLFIPDKKQKTEFIPTAKLHVFQVKTEPLKLKVLLLDVNRKPRAKMECKLDVDGTVTTETTDADGAIGRKIARSAKAGKLTLPDGEVALLVGHLDPVEEESGQLGRLNNLGYDAGEAGKSDPVRFRSAVEEFQCDQNLTVDGICGPKTQDKLKQVHGS